MTRAAAAVIVDVPGTENDPTIVTAHLKCCFDQDDPFRRAVEMLRIRKYLEEQGLGIDNLVITPLKDQDGDQIPDQEELENGTNPALADSDQDGQNDYFETFLTGTNPLSGSSRFQPDVSFEQGMVQVTFPSLSGRFYEIEKSIDLQNWTSEPGLTGTGKDVTVSFPQHNGQFFRISISLLE